jgi:hypothetical protein
MRLDILAIRQAGAAIPQLKMKGSPAITINVRRSTHQVTMEKRVTKSNAAGEVGNQPGSTLSAPPNTVGCRLVNPRDGDFAIRIKGPYDPGQGTRPVRPTVRAAMVSPPRPFRAGVGGTTFAQRDIHAVVTHETACPRMARRLVCSPEVPRGSIRARPRSHIEKVAEDVSY